MCLNIRGNLTRKMRVCKVGKSRSALLTGIGGEFKRFVELS